MSLGTCGFGRTVGRVWEVQGVRAQCFHLGASTCSICIIRRSVEDSCLGGGGGRIVFINDDNEFHVTGTSGSILWPRGSPYIGKLRPQ